MSSFFPTTSTKLKFEPKKLSDAILNKYLNSLFTKDNILPILQDLNDNFTVPDKYKDNTVDTTNYKMILQLSYMSMQEWDKIIKENGIEELYSINNSSIIQDCKYYSDIWKIIHEENKKFDAIMNFFRIAYEILNDLNQRSFIFVGDANPVTLNTKETQTDIIKETIDTQHDTQDAQDAQDAQDTQPDTLDLENEIEMKSLISIVEDDKNQIHENDNHDDILMLSSTFPDCNDY